MSMTKTKLLLLLREIIVVSCDNHVKHKTALYNMWTILRCAD